MKWLKITLVVVIVLVGGSWAYHGWTIPPAKKSAASDAPGTVHAATTDALKSIETKLAQPADPATDAKKLDLTRIVATDGALTEIVYAFGFGDRIVAADSTAQWPASVSRKPSIGYVRRLSAEGVLSVKPTLILNNIEAGPPEAIEQLRKSGVPLIDIPGEKQNRSLATVVARINAVAAALGIPEKGKEFAAAVQTDYAAVRKTIGDRKGLKGLFVFNPTVDKLTAGGTGTGAHEYFEWVGIKNVADTLDGWKPLSHEAVIGAAPDVIVTSARSHQTFATMDELLKIHGLGQTPAGKAKRVVYVDGGKFLSGGPRAGEMALEFAKLIYPDLTFPESQSAKWLREAEAKNP